LSARAGKHDRALDPRFPNEVIYPVQTAASPWYGCTHHRVRNFLYISNLAIEFWRTTHNPLITFSSSSSTTRPYIRINNGCRIRSRHWVKLPLHPTFHHTQQSNVLITRSGTGYIGSFTALALLEAGYKVVIVDNLYNSSKEVINRIELISGKRPEFYQLDIQDEAALDKVFKEHPDIDNVIHFAALKVSIPPFRCMSTC
jgi:hypothetical protein